MSTIFSFHNFIAYSVQISLLILAGTVVPWMLRLRTPQVMYIYYWRSLLGLVLLLPLIQPWKPVITEPLDASHYPTTLVDQVRVVNPGSPTLGEARSPDRKTILSSPGSSWKSWWQPVWRISGWILIGGIVIRLLSLLLGCWRLGRYRRAGRRLFPLPEAVVEVQDKIRVCPEIRISEEIESPVTYGFFRPIVLLPKAFFDLDGRHQTAVAIHELLHVRRRDWLSTLFEEMVRGLLWFQPAIWWLLERIQLFREHVVDLEVVEHTQAPKDYVQALLEVATTKGGWEMSPAPLFLTRQHLLQRISMILQEVTVSRKRVVLSLAATLVTLAFLGTVSVRGFPMQIAAPITKSMLPSAKSGLVPRWEPSNLAIPSTAQSEVMERKEDSGSISGQVTLGAGPARGVWVGLYPTSTVPGRRLGDPLASTTTDIDGSYILANLPRGNYRVKPKDPHYILSGDPEFNSWGRVLTLAEGEKIEHINFELIKSGTIAGRVTGIDGQPVGDGIINLSYLDERGQPILYMSTSTSDDQGTYRLDKLPPGSYVVSVGGYDPNGNQGRLDVTDRRPLTYFPGVADPAQAKIIKLAVGTEVSGIDMVVGLPVPVFRVNGRVLEARTNAPVANMKIGIQDDRNSTRDISNNSNTAGEYQLQDLVPGRYAVFAVSRGDLNYTSDSTPFEVVNKDLNGVDIKVVPGATISGQVALEGSSEPAVLARLAKTEAWVPVIMPDDGYREIGPVNLNSDGSFRVQGLPAGRAQLRLSPVHPAQMEFSIQRVERSGVIPTGGIELKGGEQVTGMRLVLAHGTGTLHGKVIIQGGELPAGTRLRVNARPITPGAIGSISQVEVDMRSGRFYFDRLLVGNYGITLLPIFPPTINQNRPRLRIPQPQQSVTVTEGSQAEVTLVFEISETQTRLNSIP